MINLRVSGVRLQIALVLLMPSLSEAQMSTIVSYQGWLESVCVPASGTFDLQFHLYDALENGSVVAEPVCSHDVNVVNGRFMA